MTARYVNQLEFTNPVYMPDCPVALEKGAVLLDTKTNTYFLQLKFANIGTRNIASVQACIVSLDSAKKSAYPVIQASYDEFAASGDAFGTKKLIPLPNNNAVQFGVYVLEVKTSDGQTLAFTREQYVRSGDSLDITEERKQLAQTQEEKRKSFIMMMRNARLYRIGLAVPGILLLLMMTSSQMLINLLRHLWIRGVNAEAFFNFINWWSGLWFQRFVPIVPASWLFGLRTTALYLVLVGILLLAICLYLWFSAWVSIGTPKLLKKCARLMIFMGPVLYILSIIEFLRVGRFIGMVASPFFSLHVVVLFFCAALPFVCVFINTRKHDKSLSLKRALMFWQRQQ